MHNSKPQHIAAIVIGRNEGKRLQRCLKSLEGVVSQIVYVDSGSTDGSKQLALACGCTVVELDLSLPFTAARARNEGMNALTANNSKIEFVQFLDGDCELNDLWIANGLQILRSHEDVAVVCGRRRERYPDASVYNRLCDMEWKTPVGEVNACGGDALVRIAAIKEVGGFHDELIAGEEPELCLRLRKAGWKIRRIYGEMTLHDADMHHIKQWWKRAVRCGHAYAEGFWMHRREQERYCMRKFASAMLWGLVYPAMLILLAPFTYGISLLGFGTYAFIWLKTYGHMLANDWSSNDANLYAASCTGAKFAEVVGVLTFFINRIRGHRPQIIEYKAATKDHVVT